MPSWSSQRPPIIEPGSSRECANSRRDEDEWLWGWDPTPGIVSVWAEADGRAVVWRRLAETGELVREETRFRPWVLVDRLDYLQSGDAGGVTYRELEGSG